MHWVELPQAGDDSPGPRSSHALAACGDKLYLFGGELQPRVPLPADTFCYDTTTSSWSKLKTTGCCPGPRVAATMAAVGTKLYLYGGRTGVDMGEGAKSELYVFDTSSAEWQPVKVPDDSPTPPPRSYHAMAAAPSTGKVYVFGGCGSGGRLNDLWCFDTHTHTWQQLGSDSGDGVAARGGSVLVASADGQQLYLLGGFNGDELQDCHVFDVSSGSWSCPTCCDGGAAATDNSGSSSKGKLAMLMGRSVFGAVLHSGGRSSNGSGGCGSHGSGCEHATHVVTFGGEVAPSDKGHAGAGNFTDVLHCLDPTGGSSPWHTLQLSSSTADNGAGSTATGPGPRGWFAAACTPDGNLVVHGGLGADNERRGDMFMLKMH